MKRYEGLFILNPPAKEEGLKDIIDKISKQIETAGGKVETTQKMDKRSFARVANRKHSAGYYVNFIFEVPEETVAPLRSQFRMNEDVLRILFTVAPPPKAVASAPPVVPAATR